MADLSRRSNAIIVRRGNALLGRISLGAVPERIQSNRLFGSDRVSNDGRNWVRLDQHPQFKKYFVKRGRGDGRNTLSSQVRTGADKSNTGTLLGILVLLVLLYFLFR